MEETFTDEDSGIMMDASSLAGRLFIEPGQRVEVEPTITLTQSQGVELWKQWPKQNAREAAFQGSKDVFKQAINRDATAFCVLLGVPASWADVLIEAVTKQPSEKSAPVVKTVSDLSQ